MKEITMFYLETCPHCQLARKYMGELVHEKPELANVKVQMVEGRQHPQVVDQYDFEEYPAYYIDGKKIHEGPVTKGIVDKILRMGL